MSSSERASIIDTARTISKQEYERYQNIYKPIPIIGIYGWFFTILRQKEQGQIISSNEAILVMADGPMI